MEIKIKFLIFFAFNLFCLHAERISEQKCREYGQVVLKKQVIPSPMPGGQPTVVYNSNCQHEETPLIIGGVRAARHEFPHQAILGNIFAQSRSIEWICGGSLISPRFVLSAAHCRQPNGFSAVKYVKIGVNRQDEHTRIYNVEELYEHNYDPSRSNNDILLIKLTEEVEINEFALPICLPSKQYQSEKAIVSGFGATEYANESNDLLKVTVERFTYDECRRTDYYHTRDTKLCYGHRTEFKSSCFGDSGGPLQIYNDAKIPCTYMQLGIVSYGPQKCATEPATYTNVYHYLDWIEKVVWGDSSSSSSSDE